jgi:hypothetical protein
MFDGSHFVNIRDKRCLDVSGNKDVEGQAVIAHKMHNGKNQQWNVLYLDKANKTRTDGFNEDFGWEINRPFYMVSRLPMRRVIEAVGANNMVIKRYVKGRLG